MKKNLSSSYLPVSGKIQGCPEKRLSRLSRLFGVFGLKGSWVSLRKPLFGEQMSLLFNKV